MKKELTFAMIVSGALHAGLLFGFDSQALVLNPQHNPDEPGLVDPPKEREKDPPPQVVAKLTAENPDDPLDGPSICRLPAPRLGISERLSNSIAKGAMIQSIELRDYRMPTDMGPVAIPIDQGYREISTTELVDTVNLDRMPRVRSKVDPQPPRDLKGVEADVVLMLSVDTNGRVFDVSVLRSSNSGFDLVAKTAAARWRFEPGMLNGKVVPFRIVLPFEFRVKD